MRKNSPLRGCPSISNLIFSDRSPLANAVITRATSAVGCAKLLMSELIESDCIAHEPLTVPSETRSVSFPSSPTTWPTRTSSFDVFSFRATTSLNVSAMSARIPSCACGRRTEKSPCLTAPSASSNDTSWDSASGPSGPAILPLSHMLSSCCCLRAPWSWKKTDRPGLRVFFCLSISFPLV